MRKQSTRRRTCTSAVTTLQSLPSELLCRVALHLDLEERLSLGSVSKQLYAVVREPSPLWHDVMIKYANCLVPPGSSTYSMRQAAFVQHRISAIRNAVIGPGRGEVAPTLAPLVAVLAGATALRRLCILGQTRPETVSFCGLLCQLTALEVGPVTGRLCEAQLRVCMWGLTRLQRLRLHFNLDKSREAEPGSLPPALLRLSALTHLSFGMSHPSPQHAGPPRLDFSIPEPPAELFQQLRSLQYLQLFSLGVVRLPADISLLTGLQSLSILSATALPLPQLQLPPEISACTALTSLQLSCASIPPPMWQLPLRELTLDQTHLTAGQLRHFTALSALQSLRLCNRARGGEEDLDDLAISSSLTCLRLDGNDMSTIPYIHKMDQLLELDMKRNRLDNVYEMALEQLTALRVLDLSFNDQLALGHYLEEDASTIAAMPVLRVLGLRKVPASSWGSVDLQTVSDIHSIRCGAGHPAIRTVCHAWLSDSCVEDICELDRETHFLDTVVNAEVLGAVRPWLLP